MPLMLGETTSGSTSAGTIDFIFNEGARKQGSSSDSFHVCNKSLKLRVGCKYVRCFEG